MVKIAGNGVGRTHRGKIEARRLFHPPGVWVSRMVLVLHQGLKSEVCVLDVSVFSRLQRYPGVFGAVYMCTVKG